MPSWQYFYLVGCVVVLLYIKFQNEWVKGVKGNLHLVILKKVSIPLKINNEIKHEYILILSFSTKKTCMKWYQQGDWIDTESSKLTYFVRSIFTNSVILFNWDYTISLNSQVKVEQKVTKHNINSYKTIKNTSSITLLTNLPPKVTKKVRKF